MKERTTVQTSLLGLAKQAQSNTRYRVALGLPAEASVYEEPGAGKLHAGICAGGCWVTGSPTAIYGTLTDRLSAFALRDRLITDSPLHFTD